MKIITVSGLDGSGKSTQVALLKKHFIQKGLRVHYFHAVQFSIASLLSGRSSQKPGSTLSSVRASFPSILLRKLFLCIDIVRFRFLCRSLQKQRYEIVLSDRYFYDTVVNIAFLSKSTKTLPQTLPIPKPNFSFFFDVAPEQIMLRKDVPEQGLEYLKAKDALYRLSAKKWNMRIVNANQPQEDLLRTITELIDAQ